MCRWLRAATSADASGCLLEENMDKLYGGGQDVNEICSLVHGGSAVWDCCGAGGEHDGVARPSVS